MFRRELFEDLDIPSHVLQELENVTAMHSGSQQFYQNILVLEQDINAMRREVRRLLMHGLSQAREEDPQRAAASSSRAPQHAPPPEWAELHQELENIETGLPATPPPNQETIRKLRHECPESLLGLRTNSDEILTEQEDVDAAPTVYAESLKQQELENIEAGHSAKTPPNRETMRTHLLRRPESLLDLRSNSDSLIAQEDVDAALSVNSESLKEQELRNTDMDESETSSSVILEEVREHTWRESNLWDDRTNTDSPTIQDDVTAAPMVCSGSLQHEEGDVPCTPVGCPDDAAAVGAGDFMESETHDEHVSSPELRDSTAVRRPRRRMIDPAFRARKITSTRVEPVFTRRRKRMLQRDETEESQSNGYFIDDVCLNPGDIVLHGFKYNCSRSGHFNLEDAEIFLVKITNNVNII